MKVDLISYTPDALNLLLFTKQTRLAMDAGLMEEIRQWPEDRKAKELAYMLGTIESSWEFVDYTFSIQGVSRAFTHQLVRTREDPDSNMPGTGPSYAQQSQRTVNMDGFEFVWPEAIAGDQVATKHGWFALREINDTYNNLIKIGKSPQDARAFLPTNVSTNIMVKFNLATMSRMAEKRLCSRTQGEYQNVFRAMRLLVLGVHPWAEPFIRVACAKRGVCAFPNYKECPIKPGIFNPETGGVWEGTYEDKKFISLYTEQLAADGVCRPISKPEIQARWEGMKYEAVPTSEMKRGQ